MRKGIVFEVVKQRKHPTFLDGEKVNNFLFTKSLACFCRAQDISLIYSFHALVIPKCLPEHDDSLSLHRDETYYRRPSQFSKVVLTSSVSWRYSSTFIVTRNHSISCWTLSLDKSYLPIEMVQEVFCTPSSPNMSEGNSQLSQ